MKLLITGATGFVGKALTETASQAGHEVSALVRKHSQILPQGVEQIVAGDFLRFVGKSDSRLRGNDKKESGYAEKDHGSVELVERGNNSGLISSEAEKSQDASASVGMTSKEVDMPQECHSERSRGILKDVSTTFGITSEAGSMTEDFDFEHLMSAFQDVDVVIHTAARAHVMKEEHDDPAVIYHLMNVALTQKLALAAADAGVKRFVIISSIKVNGEASTQPFSEADVPAPEDDYGRSKWLAEQCLAEIGQRTGMEIVILRPPLIYGPGVKGNLAGLIKLISKGIPLPFGTINNRRSLLALDNLVSAILLVSEHPAAANQTFLLADDEDISTKELIKLIAQSHGKKARLIPVPVSWMTFAARLFGKKSVADRLFGSLQIDASKIRQLLGWKPVTSMVQQLVKINIERLG